MKIQIIKNFWIKCFGKRGFTLGETVASMISLSIVALSAQSLIIMSSQFRSNTKRSFASMENQNHYHNLICSHFQNPVAVQVDRSRTYHYDSGTQTYSSLGTDGTKRIAETNQPTLAYVFDTTTSNPLLSANIQGITRHQDNPIPEEIDMKTKIPLTDKSVFYIEDGKIGEEDGHKDSYYDRPSVFFLSYFPIYADSHTLINYVPVPRSLEESTFLEELGKSKDHSGFIVATRCIENSEFNEIEEIGSLLDFSNFNMSEYETEIDAQERATQALYILSNQKVPFYIDFDKQNGKKGKTIICADHKDSIKLEAGDTSANEYTPVTFIIEFEAIDPIAVIRNGKKHSEWGYEYNPSGESFELFSGVASGNSNESEDMFSSIPSSAKDLEYANRIRDEFSMAVEFTRITEVPFGASSDIWSSSFIATSPITTKTTYPSFFNLDFIDVKSTCNPQLYKCPLSPAGKNLSDIYLDKRQEKRIADFFRLETKSCPFRYTRLDNTGQAVPLGVTIIPE